MALSECWNHLSEEEIRPIGARRYLYLHEGRRSVVNLVESSSRANWKYPWIASNFAKKWVFSWNWPYKVCHWRNWMHWPLHKLVNLWIVRYHSNINTNRFGDKEPQSTPILWIFFFKLSRLHQIVHSFIGSLLKAKGDLPCARYSEWNCVFWQNNSYFRHIPWQLAKLVPKHIRKCLG